MTMHSKPSKKGTVQQADDFIKQAAAADQVQLHCLISHNIHRRVRMLAVNEDTTVTKLVHEALETLLRHRN